MIEPRDVAEMLDHLGHLGTRGRRPRILNGTITAVDGDTVSASIMGGEPVDGLDVAAEYGGGRMPVPNEEVRIEAVQFQHTVIGTRMGG